MTTATAKKITVATVKSFIKKNLSALMVRVKSSFDGMQDMVTENECSGFSPAQCRDYYCNETFKYVPVSADNKHSMGIMGVWFTGRDRCHAFETDTHRGFEVYNCCGNWFVAVAK
jgi:hypothetical protein